MDIDKILKAIKKEFNEDYIKSYVYNNSSGYVDEEEMEVAGYDDMYEYYTEEGAGGNGLEYDLIEEMRIWAEEKFKIKDLVGVEDFRYGLDYYIKEFFPYWYFVDYRIKSGVDNLMDSLDKL